MKGIVSGKEVFYLMDTKGVPLELIIEIFRDKDVGFHVGEFIEAAIDSKNYTRKKIISKLVSLLPEYMKKGFLEDVSKI